MMNKKRIVWVTSLLCLLPMIFSAAVYSKLPAEIPIHWNYAGVADNYVHKAVGGFGLPVLFLAINLVLSKMRLLWDPKAEGQASAIRQISIWSVPAVSVIFVPISLCIAMGADIPVDMVASLLVGIILIVVGNYLPKSRQNYTVGIKLPWTLHDANNWNKTHRLAGYVYIACGGLLIVANFLLGNALARAFVGAAVIVALALVPAIYSFFLYRREGAEG